jgi:hypothetical protein
MHQKMNVLRAVLGEITPSYILHTRTFGTYLLGGVFTLHIDYKVMVFYM